MTFDLLYKCGPTHSNDQDNESWVCKKLLEFLRWLCEYKPCGILYLKGKKEDILKPINKPKHNLHRKKICEQICVSVTYILSKGGAKILDICGRIPESQKQEAWSGVSI